MQTNTQNDELQKRLAFFEDQCRARGLRVTNQRREIFRAVAASCEHPSADARKSRH